MESFGNALKAFRRGVYVADTGYNCLVVCANAANMAIAFDEALLILNASSLEVKQVSYSERKIYCERGGMLWFRVRDVPTDTLRGVEWPHIITLCEIPQQKENELLALNRSFNEKAPIRFDHASL